ncbi:MAG: phosphatase PAP2 family protein [Thermomicrobiales bacterium]
MNPLESIAAARRQAATWAIGHLQVALLLPALLAALALSAIASGSGVLAWDVTITRFVQRAPDTVFGDIARAVNLLGDAPIMLALSAGLVLTLLKLGRTEPALFLLAAVVASVANPVLKAICDSPRPTADLVRIAEEAAGLGFPSGHVMKVVLTYGAILVLSRDLLPRRGPRLLVQAWAVGIIVATGFSRIYVGAHWPSDVVGGYLWGGVLLGALGTGYRSGVFARARAAMGTLVGDRRVLSRDGAAD